MCARDKVNLFNLSGKIVHCVLDLTVTLICNFY